MAEAVSFLIKISDNGTFKKVEVDVESLRNAVHYVKEVTDRLNNSIVNWAQASQAIDLLQQSFDQLQNMVQDSRRRDLEPDSGRFHLKYSCCIKKLDFFWK